MSLPRSDQRENRRRENSAKLQKVAIEEFFVVEDAKENWSDGVQQPSADGLALGVSHALYAGDGVRIFDFALHVSSLILTGPMWRTYNIAQKAENPRCKKVLFYSTKEEVVFAITLITAGKA
jgi:hypothetical protein